MAALHARMLDDVIMRARKVRAWRKTDEEEFSAYEGSFEDERFTVARMQSPLADMHYETYLLMSSSESGQFSYNRFLRAGKAVMQHGDDRVRVLYLRAERQMSMTT